MRSIITTWRTVRRVRREPCLMGALYCAKPTTCGAGCDPVTVALNLGIIIYIIASLEQLLWPSFDCSLHDKNAFLQTIFPRKS